MGYYMPAMTSREFNQNTSRAKKVAKGGPVFITDRGQPSHVLLSIDDTSHRVVSFCDYYSRVGIRGTDIYTTNIPDG